MELGENLIPDLNTLCNTLTPSGTIGCTETDLYRLVEINSTEAEGSINIRSYGVVCTESNRAAGNIKCIEMYVGVGKNM